MRGLRRAWLVAAIVGVLGAVPGPAAGARLRLHHVGDFKAPTYAAGAPGDRRRLFVVEREGRVRVVRDGRVLARPFLDIHRQVSTFWPEAGMFSIAFAPGYARTGRFYLDYSDSNGDVRVREFRRATRDRADPRSGRDVLVVPHSTSGSHYGGQLAFGPDRLLYVGVGDAKQTGSSQQLDNLLGKILRIDPRPSGASAYGLPLGNPFLGLAGARPEVWAWGLRNPWRFSFDAATGGMAIGDVGEHDWEEIDFAPPGRGAGANYGWPAYEGLHQNAGFAAASATVAPLVEYPHGQSACAVIAGYVVRDPALPAFAGRLVFGDLCRPQIDTVRLRPGRAGPVRYAHAAVPGLVSFGQDTSQRLYAVSLNGGVYRLVPGR